MTLSLVALAAWFAEGLLTPALSAYVSLMALPAPGIALFHVARAIEREEAEREFAAWFRVPDGSTLELRNGWWYVVPVDDAYQPTPRTKEGVPAPSASCDGLS